MLPVTLVFCSDLHAEAWTQGDSFGKRDEAQVPEVCNGLHYDASVSTATILRAAFVKLEK